ncbi:MAG TPA: hypothetical protein VLH86_04350 [Patescibacteria group bacterium]|nr:hypothetical protein [Patescibacteria group bacterium]
MAPEATAPAQLHLPYLVFGVVEVRRLKRELEMLEEFIRQGEIRTPGKQAALPRLSRLLDAAATDNHLQLLQPEHRQLLREFLANVEAKAPTVHISFAIDPSSAFTAKMVTWLRANIDPNMLLEVGLQPTIAAGCVLRTTNKVFDFSLRERFGDAEGLLMKALESAGEATGDTADMQAQPAVATTTATPAAEVSAEVPATPAAQPVVEAIDAPSQAQLEAAAVAAAAPAAPVEVPA